MKEIDLEVVRQLREKTGAGVGDCSSAIRQADGNLEKAIEILRKKGVEMMVKKASRVAGQGCVESYIHLGGKIGVLIEVNCETDFVARTEDFQTFVKDLTLQIAASNPPYISREQVPAGVLEHEKERKEKYFEENCLLDQIFIKDQTKKIKDYLAEVSAKVGEKVVINRFVRYQLGETG